jgi:hypothetical protein
LWNAKGLEVNPNTEVGITAGAMEALLAAFLPVVERCDEVIVVRTVNSNIQNVQEEKRIHTSNGVKSGLFGFK